MDKFTPTFLLAAVALLFVNPAHADPQPGDVYREYIHTRTYGDAGGSNRVGGKLGQSHPDRGSDFGYTNAWIKFPHVVDLELATRAEVVVEKILSHNGTKGLAVRWNDGEWIDLPAPEAIPKPRDQYYHHTGIVVPVPRESLREGDDNRFRLKVSPEQDWGWPQNLVYGVHLRVFYDADKKDHVAGRLTGLSTGDSIGEHVKLAIEIPDRKRRVDRVDYVGLYENVNWPGDGVYRRWQFFYYRGQFTHHIGSSVVAPFDARWDTSWIPDQKEPMRIAARIIDDTGLIHLTPAVTGLKLERPGLAVELCRPEDVPENWVTRNGAFQETVTITGDLQRATAARLTWSSWSPGYMNGVTVNGVSVVAREGPNYRYYDHELDLKDLAILQPGKNVIATGKTPLHDGKMVHGMEVNWPGIQLLIQYRKGR